MSYFKERVEFAPKEQFQQVPDRDFYIVKMGQEALWALQGYRDIKRGRKTDTIDYPFELAESCIGKLIGMMPDVQFTDLNYDLEGYASLVYEGKQARNRIVMANLNLVHTIVNKYAASGVPLEDLEGAGILALYRSAELFDPNRKTAFSTFAGLAIERHIRRYINRNRFTINLPNDYVRTRDSTAEAQSVEGSISISEFEDVLSGFDERSCYLRDTALQAVENIEVAQLYEILEKVLTHKQLMIFKMDIKGYSSEEIGKRFGVTDSRINQIKQEITQIILEQPEVQEIFSGMLTNPFK